MTAPTVQINVSAPIHALVKQMARDDDVSIRRKADRLLMLGIVYEQEAFMSALRRDTDD